MPDMKTHQEMLVEAQHLEEFGRRYWADHRAGLMHRERNALHLMALPDSQVTSEHLGIDPVHTHRRRRWIEAALDGEVVEFLLLQDEVETTEDGRVVRRVEPFASLRSNAAVDALSDGYEAIEEERLGELLAPYSDRIGEEGFIDSIDPALIGEIEAIVGAAELSPSGRMRTRADIVEFLEGRLEPSEFISATVKRQCFRESEREMLAERHGERMQIE
jgi:hypothetical protein